MIIEILKGKSLTRILENNEYKNIELKGKVIDLGSKSDNASFYRFVKSKYNANITFTDFNPTADGLLKINLEENLDIESEQYDMAILNNVLEHIYNHQNCINETYRILKSGGVLMGTVPYIHKIHYDPDDYFRYSKSSLINIFKSAGFSKIKIKELGYGPFSASVSIVAPLLKFNTLKAFAYMISIGLDKILHKIKPNHNNIDYKQFPLGYFFYCEK